MTNPLKRKKNDEKSGVFQSIEDALLKLDNQTMKSLDQLTSKIRVVRQEAQEVQTLSRASHPPAPAHP